MTEKNLQIEASRFKGTPSGSAVSDSGSKICTPLVTITQNRKLSLLTRFTLLVLFLCQINLMPSPARAFLLERPSLQSMQDQRRTKFLSFQSYFNYQCQQRAEADLKAGKFHDDCLIARLLDAYIANNFVLESPMGEAGILNENFVVRKNWTTVDLLSGFFNETFSWGDNELGIKPIINKLILEIAIRKELKKFKGFLDANPRAALFRLKRHFYPEMMAHFGGFSLLARASAYRSAMSCDFARVCPADEPNCLYGLQCPDGEPNCGATIQKECHTADQALRYIIGRGARKLAPVAGNMIDDFKMLSENPTYTESQVIFDGIENAEILYNDIEQNIDGASILAWANNPNPCDPAVENNPIEALCAKLDDSMAYPKSIRNKTLADALLASLIVWESQHVLAQYQEAPQTLPERVDEFTGLRDFLNQTDDDLGQEFLESIEKIRTHFLDYDPSKLVNPTPGAQSINSPSQPTS